MADMINQLLGDSSGQPSITTATRPNRPVDKATEQIKKPFQLSDNDMARLEMMNIDKVNLAVALAPIGNLASADVEGLMTQLAKNATNFDTDRYTRISSDAVGKYGLTIRQLEDLKILRAGVTDRQSSGIMPDVLLNNPGNWDGRGSRPDTLAEFLSNSVMQEKTMIQLLTEEYSRLIFNLVIDSSDSKEIVAGVLAVSLVVGARKSSQWRAGKILNPTEQITCDRNFDFGRYAVMILGAK